jgi:hypothetical protein
MHLRTHIAPVFEKRLILMTHSCFLTPEFQKLWIETKFPSGILPDD